MESFKATTNDLWNDMMVLGRQKRHKRQNYGEGGSTDYGGPNPQANLPLDYSSNPRGDYGGQINLGAFPGGQGYGSQSFGEASRIPPYVRPPSVPPLLQEGPRPVSGGRSKCGKFFSQI